MTDLRRPGSLTCEDVRDLAAGFVLDALPPAEADAVRAHVDACDDPHVELLELAGALPALAETVPVMEPPAGLRDRIMAAAAADLALRQGTAPALATESSGPIAAQIVPTAFPAAAEREARAARRRPSIGAWALGLAAVLAIVALGSWNLTLQGQLGAARSYEQSVAAVLDIAGQDGSLAAVLTPTDGAGPSGLAAVGVDGRVRIAMRALPATSGDQVYETWVIGSDGVPIAVGGFRVGADGSAFFETNGIPAAPGTVLALTLEPRPGATAPSSAPVSLGTVSAAG